MMKDDWKKIFWQMGLMILISTVLLVVVNAVISRQQRDVELKLRNDILRQTIDVTVYEELVLPPGIAKPNFVEGLYRLHVRDVVNGYLLCISTGEEEKKIFHLVYDVTGSTLTDIKLYDETETISLDLPEDFIDEVCSIRLPVMTNIDAERLRSAVPPPLDGLKDGLYRNTASEPNRDNYTDFVEIHVENGWIVQVKWDGIGDDTEKRTRAQASVDGDYDAYNNRGNMWAQQAYFMEKALLEIQNPSQISVKSDGTTDSVDGVTCEIAEFVKLADRCVQDSRAGKIYVPGTDEDDASTHAEEADEGASENDENTREKTVHPDSADQTTVVAVTDSSVESPIRTSGQPGGTLNKNYSPGGEDGIIVESDEENGRIYGFFRDEIRSVIVGQEENFQEEQRILLAVNRGYAFLQTCLESIG